MNQQKIYQINEIKIEIIMINNNKIKISKIKLSFCLKTNINNSKTMIISNI